MKLTQNQFYGKLIDMPRLPKGSTYTATDTGQIFIYGDGSKPIEAGSSIKGTSSVAGIPISRFETDQLNKNNSVAYINLIGQSNADGTASRSSEDAITTPMSNVFHLTRSTAIVDDGGDGSAWTDESTWGWTGYTTNSLENNLGRYLSGERQNFTAELAIAWQTRIDNGENLPDLYLTHMSYSGSGFGKYASGAARFNPLEDAFKDDRVNIWNGSLKLHSWALNNLLDNNYGVVHLGLNNNQWEHDGKNVEAATNYQAWVESLLAEHDKIAGIKIPFSYFVPSTPAFDGKFGAYLEAAQSLENISGRPKIALDPKKSVLYDPTITGSNSGYLGIYNDDVHYKNTVFGEFKDQFFAANGHEGILVTSTVDAGIGSVDLTNIYTKPEVDSIVSIATNQTIWEANSYISSATNITLPGVSYETIDTPASGWQSLKEADNKKYFRLVGRGNKYSFLTFEGLPKDTQYGSMVTRLKTGSGISIGAGFLLNPITGTSFQNAGREFVSLTLICDTRNGQLGDPTKYKIQIWKVDSNIGKLAEVEFDNTGMPLGSGESGVTADVDVKFSCLEGSTANERTFVVSYKLIDDETYTVAQTVSNVDISSMSSAALAGGDMGLISGLGDIFTDAPISSMRFKSFSIISEE